MKAKYLIDLLETVDPDSNVNFAFVCNSCLTEFPSLEVIEDSVDSEGELTIVLEDNGH